MNAQVHEGLAGEALWDRCIELGIEVRKKLRQFGCYYARTGGSAEEKWFFDPFVPDVVTIRDSPFMEDMTAVRWESVPTDVLKREQQCWTFNPDASWHGYANYANDYAMVDPNKLTLLTPGINRHTGEYLDFGVPATVLANYLREQRIVPEKCDLNSILFLMTPAEDESKLNSLIAKLVKFKSLWDRDAALAEVLPSICAAHPQRYAGYTLRQVCHEMHGFYRAADIKELYDIDKRLADLALLSAPTNRKIINDHARTLRETQTEMQELQERKEAGRGDVKALETEIAAAGKRLDGLTASLIADGKPTPLSDKLYSGDGEEVKDHEHSADCPWGCSLGTGPETPGSPETLRLRA